MFSINANGSTRVANRYRTAASKAPQTIDKIMGAHMQTWRKDLKAEPYAPKRTGQKYIRTGNLANSWRVHKRGLARYSIVNSASYSMYVVDKKKQAWMHEKRWWTAQDILGQRARRKSLTKDLTRAIVKDINGTR